MSSLRERIEDAVAAIILQARAAEHNVGVAKPSVARSVDAVMAAINGEAPDRIWWCEEHRSEGFEPIDGYAICWYAGNHLAQNQRAKMDRCRVVERHLVPVQSAEAKETP